MAMDLAQFADEVYDPKDPGTLGKVQPRQSPLPESASDLAAERFKLEEQRKQQVDDPTIASLRARQAQYERLASQPTPIPRDPKLIDPTPRPPQNFSDPIKAFQNPGVFIATLGSLFSRAPMTAALNAGGAAMEAYHKGEAEVFAQQRQLWQDNLEVALLKNRIALDKLNNEWKKSEVATKDKLAKMQAIAAGEGMDKFIAVMESAHFGRMDKFLEGLETAQQKNEEILLKEQGRTKLDPAIRNKIGMYPGLTASDLRDISVPNQRRLIGAFESGEHLEAIAKYAQENPEAYGLLADATKRMKLDAYTSLFSNKPISKEVVDQTQNDRDKLIDDTAREKGYNPAMAAKAKILSKMLTTQSFADAAAAGSRGATVYLDRAFREIYDQASTPEAFFGILEKRYDDSNTVLKQYNMGFDKRVDKENLPFWNGKAQGFVQGQGASSVPEPSKRIVGKVYNTPKGPLEWTGTGWIKPRPESSL